MKKTENKIFDWLLSTNYVSLVVSLTWKWMEQMALDNLKLTILYTWTFCIQIPSYCFAHKRLTPETRLLRLVNTFLIAIVFCNIGWHWGLYENILHASWWYSPRWYGEVNIIMTSAVYSHTTRNKAIQYYDYYHIIWSWLRNTNYSHVHCLCKLAGLTTTVINIAYRSRQDQTSLLWLTNSFLANYCCTYVTTIVKHLYIAWLSLYLVISMNSSR